MKQIRIPSIALASVLCLTAIANALAGTHTWTGGGSDDNWGNPANWAGGQPLVGEAAPVVLIFTNGVSTTNNMSGLVVDSLQFHAAGASVHGSGIGSLTIRGGNHPTNLWFKAAACSLEQTLPLSFTGSNYCVVATSQNGSIFCAIGGTGDITWDGGGVVYYRGTTANTCTGTTRTRSIELKLTKPAGVNAIAGPLVLDYVAGSPSYVVELLDSNQILDSAPVTLNGATALLAQGFNETLSDLNMNGGLFNLVAGTLTLTGNLDVNGAATINNPVSLGGATRTINVTSGDLTINKAISNGAAAAGITKSGAGSLLLQGTNTFTGAVTVNAGKLILENNSALGTTAGGLSLVTGTLELHSVNIGAEALTLNSALIANGTNSWAGAVNIASETTFTGNSNSEMTFSGAVSGAGSLSMFGSSALVFSGASANTWAGGLAVYGGTVSLNKTGANAIAGPLLIGPGTATVKLLQANQIADTVAVTVYPGCTFDLNNNSDTIGSLAGAGTVNLIFAGLTLGGDNSSTTFSGNIGGIGLAPITKNGSGTFTLTGTNYCSGTSFVNAGTLEVLGQLDSHVSVAAGATLRGSGKVGNVRASAGNIIPGNSVGILNTGSLNLTNGTVTLTFEINGNTPGTLHDQIAAAGAVNLINPSLALSLNTFGAVSNQYVLIANDGSDPVQGAFTGLPEGATLTSGMVSFKITYQGGTGNDVALIQTAAPPSPQITNIVKHLNGNVTLAGQGLAGMTYYVDATTDLGPANWTYIGSTVANGSGVISFTDTSAASFPQRFYRLRLQ